MHRNGALICIIIINCNLFRVSLGIEADGVMWDSGSVGGDVA
jgi:hypothetical protein